MDRTLAELSFDEFARYSLQRLLDRASQEWRHCAQVTDPDAIHDFRVSLRRFGEAIRLFKILLPKAGRRQVRRELRQAMRLAGRTRDVDIACEAFVDADTPLSPELDLVMKNERAICAAALAGALAVGQSTGVASRWLETLQLSTLANPPPASPAAQSNHASPLFWRPGELSALNARSVLPGLFHAYCERGDKIAAEGVKPARLHELRLAGKHLRYSLEIFRPIYGRRMDDLLDSFKRGQSDLGAINDAIATIDWLKAHDLHQTQEARQVRIFLEHRAGKGAGRFVQFWRDHWGLPSFRARWAGYLAHYAGRLGPVRNPPRREEAPPDTTDNSQAMATILSQADEMSDSGTLAPYSGVKNP